MLLVIKYPDYFVQLNGRLDAGSAMNPTGQLFDFFGAVAYSTLAVTLSMCTIGTAGKQGFAPDVSHLTLQSA